MPRLGRMFDQEVSSLVSWFVVPIGVPHLLWKLVKFRARLKHKVVRNDATMAAC